MSIASDVGTAAFSATVLVPKGRLVEPRLYRFTVDQYHRLAELGAFEADDRIELFEGLVLEMPPPGPPHAYGVEASSQLLSQSCPAGWTVRSQQPVTLKSSELQPDTSVVRGVRQDYRRRHPSASDIGLLVEVSESSLDFDQTQKANVYAESGIARYWIIDLVHRQVAVYTDAVPASGLSPARYAHREVFREDEKVPFIVDGRTIVEIPVSDLLP
jgi:Uma2 family endonuclease